MGITLTLVGLTGEREVPVELTDPLKSQYQSCDGPITGITISKNNIILILVGQVELFLLMALILELDR